MPVAGAASAVVPGPVAGLPPVGPPSADPTLTGPPLAGPPLADPPAAPVDLPPFTAATLVTQAGLDSWLTVALVLAGALYLYAVHRLRARGDRWPLARTVLFLGPGLGSIAVATLSGLHAYDTALLSVHMVQHMVLSMIAPIFLALGAPVTLALRTLPGRPRRALVRVLHSRPVRVLAFPLVAYAIFVANPFLLYFSGLYRLSLENALVHEFVHLHFVLTGCLFFWPLLGLDPLPGRWPYPGRALLMLLSTPLHAVLGLTIMQSTQLLGGDWYPSLGLDWSDPRSDQRVAGGILWAGGEVVSVTMLAVLLVQWMREAEREARRVDRQLDRAEVAQARADARSGDRVGTGTEVGAGDDVGRGDEGPGVAVRSGDDVGRGDGDPGVASGAGDGMGPGVAVDPVPPGGGNSGTRADR